jgi:hypothetical protein
MAYSSDSLDFVISSKPTGEFTTLFDNPFAIHDLII